MDTLAFVAETQGDAIALQDHAGTLSWSAMMKDISRLADFLSAFNGKTIALMADNSIDWVLVDLACLQAGVTLFPIPVFFSQQQREFSLNQSGAVALITDQNMAFDADRLINTLKIINLEAEQEAEIPAGTVKMTFTSGSTGEPKGVCLSEQNQLSVAKAIVERIGIEKTKHLCVLPLPTLLENIAGIYSPLLSGGQVVLLPAAQLGFNGSSNFNVDLFTRAIDFYQPNSLILLPGLLSALVIKINSGWTPPTSLKFVAVGGSRVGSGLLQSAKAAGLPIYEGYGLSECSSVVSLNSPVSHQTGSAGKPLSHINVTLENDEVVVRGNSFLGYVNEPESWLPEAVYTGDIGFLDKEGYLHIMGRKKNLLINSFGRNINPEWVESEVLSNPIIAQCVVTGDARPYCVALIYPRHPSVPDSLITKWLKQLDSVLPDYAQVNHWIRLENPLNMADGTLTANGKPVRDEVTRLFEPNIEMTYKEQA
ncbi:AMP-binding protein [Methylophaga sp.]|uniref:AMP-binding protein n=1 Tax=Methylophaga sp. TaxID=2024840 RepID=UPI003F6A4775